MQNNENENLKIPNHLAIILDGNGRWAKKRGMPRVFGHRKGAFNLVDIAKECNRLNIGYLTVFCFSTENWTRDQDEVNYIMHRPVRYFQRYMSVLTESTIRIKVIGRTDRIPEDLKKSLDEMIEDTKDHTGLTLTLCIDYGSIDEITTAVKNIALDVKEGKLNIDDINASTIDDHLFTAGYPKLDLLIRTSGECRISNFLLWQLAYSELYFTDTYWPDFNEEELHKALVSYTKRDRRFGGLTGGAKK